MISWGLVGLDLSYFLGPVGLFCGMQQVRSLCARMATGGMPVSFGRFWLLV
jgi:hypothetical protein